MTQAATLGADRVVAPIGALPQAATRIDAEGPVRTHELEIEVDALHLDSTSFAQLVRAAGGEPDGVADAIAAIVAERGKMHNPETGSGGVLVGTVVGTGPDYPDPPSPGTRVVTLASLTLTPLRLDDVGPVDLSTPRVAARGRAYLPSSASWAAVPDDLPLETVLATLDVCGAPSHTRALAGPGQTVVVLGAGHAGLLSLVAAREAVGESGRVVAVDAAESLFVPGRPAKVVDTTGAGDCFCGVLAAGLASGLPMARALERANAAAAISVTRPGAVSSLPTADEIDGLLAQ